MPVVKLEAQMLNVVIEIVAKIVGCGIAKCFAKVRLPKGEQPSKYADAQNRKRDDEYGGKGVIAVRNCVGYSIHGVAEELRQREICGGCAQHAHVGGKKPPFVRQRKSKYSKKYLHILLTDVLLSGIPSANKAGEDSDSTFSSAAINYFHAQNESYYMK
jgi:hypothetical protein